MIFSRLFAPKHTHADPEVRIQAIATLDPVQSEDKSRLHELAFNDADADVSLAALARLGSFDLWLKMSQIARDPKVKKAAQKEVITTLCDEQLTTLSAAQRKANALEIKDVTVLKAVLENTTLFASDAQSLNAILRHIHEPDFTRKVIVNIEDTGVQQNLIESINETGQLNKLRKSIKNTETLEYIDKRLDELHQRAQRPIILQQQLTLSLSKLLALADNGDYLSWQDKRAALTQEINASLEELATLASEQAAVLREKRDTIQSRLDAIYVSIAEKIASVSEQARQQALVDQWKETRKALLQTAKGMLEDGLASKQSLDTTAVRADIEQHMVTMDDYAWVDGAQKGDLLSALRKTAAELAKLPEHIAVITNIEEKLAILKQENNAEPPAVMSDEAVRTFNGLNDDIKKVLKTASGSLKAPVITEWYAIRKAWQQALTDYDNQLQAQRTFCKNKIRTGLALIKQGKFKAAISIYAKVQHAFAELSESARKPLIRQYEQFSDEVAQLKDWQSYVATPRRPELVKQMIALADNITDDIEARRKAISTLRADWQSLGPIDSNSELAVAFDEAAEKAYAPCKAFFAKQAELREGNKQKAITLLAALETLSTCEQNDEFISRYMQLRKDWFALGEIGRKDWQSLKQRFNELCQPLQQRANDIQKEHAQQKLALIEQAKQIAETLPCNTAASLKALQEAWKSVGYAGQGKDHRLWQQFKSVNDEGYAKLKALKVEHAQKSNEVLDEMNAAINAINVDVDVADATKPWLSQVEQALETVRQTLIAAKDDSETRLQLKHVRQIEASLSHLHKTAKAKNAEHYAKQQADVTNSAFEYLQSIVGTDTTLDNNPNIPFKVLAPNTDEDISRHALTLQMEIIAQLDSPAQDIALREQQQLQLMTRKLQEGESVSMDDLWSAWLSLGPISQTEAALLERAKLAYTQAKQG
ncbi:DUF349 domain-containing protein [Alteromonas facilis]|uniref:DUF349 domain-containing protein n=1 Tax=Alteromonas facilis TaxID=2048004 RepID=UPI000C28FCE0|nr:DUF349 domain-containing protein [Alteromonas facilis]